MNEREDLQSGAVGDGQYRHQVAAGRDRTSAHEARLKLLLSELGGRDGQAEAVAKYVFDKKE
ncbi:MAG TPA: hypothetical protein PKE27_03635 [Povalibacter sp.]|uniref:hypothetical protein n=1 Tax=Povalibacter sp. TaxID=1962978 RepID=UPI002C32A1E0|nr:hypothetical protein [Povalibacter sp.]HMN43632.1 hypothetical protein [Povalibacter sp.]